MFKIGDRVKLAKNSIYNSYISLNEILIITSIAHYDKPVYFLNGNIYRINFYKEDLVLYEQEWD